MWIRGWCNPLQMSTSKFGTQLSTASTLNHLINQRADSLCCIQSRVPLHNTAGSVFSTPPRAKLALQHQQGSLGILLECRCLQSRIGWGQGYIFLRVRRVQSRPFLHTSLMDNPNQTQIYINALCNWNNKELDTESKWYSNAKHPLATENEASDKAPVLRKKLSDPFT